MKSNKTFLEIGACDFDTCLPLAKQGWSGVIFEPHPVFAERLRSVVQEQELSVEIVEQAVSNSKYSTTLLGPTQSAIEEFEHDPEHAWINGISNLTSQWHSLITHNIDQGHFDASLFVEYDVQCISLDEVICTRFNHIDFMKIDTEGHELDILNAYNWSVYPDFMKIEHKHVDNTQLFELVRLNGYYIHIEQDDIYCIRY